MNIEIQPKKQLYKNISFEKSFYISVVSTSPKVKINGAQVTQLELKCPLKGYRARVNGKMGNFTDLPNESCELFFKPMPDLYAQKNITCNIRTGKLQLGRENWSSISS